MHILTEIKNRGVNDVLMLVGDGLKGLPDVVEYLFFTDVDVLSGAYLGIRTPSVGGVRNHWPRFASPSPGTKARCGSSMPET
ncbi:transposase (plasmid) [Streptomyces sp. NBC_01276]